MQILILHILESQKSAQKADVCDVMIYGLLYRRVCAVGVCGPTCRGGALIKASEVNFDGKCSSLNNTGMNKTDDLKEFTLHLLLVIRSLSVYIT